MDHTIPFSDPPEDGCWNCELKPLKWKGELGDGHIHMTATEFVEHRSREDFEKNKQALRKLANNPILSKEAQEAIRFAAYRMDDIIWQRKIISDLRETIKNIGGNTK